MSDEYESPARKVARLEAELVEARRELLREELDSVLGTWLMWSDEADATDGEFRAAIDHMQEATRFFENFLGRQLMTDGAVVLRSTGAPATAAAEVSASSPILIEPVAAATAPLLSPSVTAPQPPKLTAAPKAKRGPKAKAPSAKGHVRRLGPSSWRFQSTQDGKQVRGPSRPSPEEAMADRDEWRATHATTTPPVDATRSVEDLEAPAEDEDEKPAWTAPDADGRQTCIPCEGEGIDRREGGSMCCLHCDGEGYRWPATEECAEAAQ